MSYWSNPLGEPPPPEVLTSGEEFDPASELVAPLMSQRGFIRVPSYDVRQYVQTTLQTLAIGFGAGVGIGAIFGNILGGRKSPGITEVFRNPRRRRRSSRPRRNARRTSRRRTSTRKRKRGRPAGGPVSERLTVKLPDGFWDVSVDRGSVKIGRKRYGSVYDLGTSFRAIPIRGEVRSFGTLAGAVKHVLRHSEAA